MSGQYAVGIRISHEKLKAPMVFMNRWIAVYFLLCLSTLVNSVPATGAEWFVPVGGNAFLTESAFGSSGQGSGRRSGGFQREGGLVLREGGGQYSIFFRVDRPAVFTLSLNAQVAEGRAILAASVLEQKSRLEMEGADFANHSMGTYSVSAKGYVRVDIELVERLGQAPVEIRDLVVSSSTEDLVVDYVRNNEGNMFYWGRRGPSVHLRYDVPRGKKLRYAYSEITVPKGEDPQGSYFMANGFGEGYFGFQVNGPEERRVLFSVWSPFQTDNPKDIPEDKRIVVLKRGAGVRIGEFGNEGSGGQSFLIYPWKSGVTYRFLTEVHPDGEGNTVYTSWFGDKDAGEWRLIASFRRPYTSTDLQGFHSFLESFDPTFGYIGRRALYGNVWVCDTDGIWHECTKARFSVDATGGGRHRLDFSGGVEGGSFFMRNCGFFDETGKPGEQFVRGSTASSRPEIDFAELPQGE
jgi:hypothetical protein